jgi:very-short-patch-repair endonuclease
MHSRLRDRARELRRRATDAERALWALLRRRQRLGALFHRQQPIGRFIVDFVCWEHHLVIEVDDGQHTERRTYDAARTRWLEENGFTVLRFWNTEVLREQEAVVQVIDDALSAGAELPLLPVPLPPGGRGRGPEALRSS